MKIACLCPTYGRPELLANAIAQFERQDYPAADRRLFALDDSGLLRDQDGDGWELTSIVSRFPSLPHKYNMLLAFATAWHADAVVVWEDDDIYLPWHLRANAEALDLRPWAHPRMVGSLYTGEYQEELAEGRFHAALAFRIDFLVQLGGWPATLRADFDQRLIAKANELGGQPAMPDVDLPPSYVFRWGSTGHIHGQSFMLAPADEGWYHRVPKPRGDAVDRIEPRMDAETEAVWSARQGGRQNE